MRSETLFPLGKVDPGLRAPETGLDLDAVAVIGRYDEIGAKGCERFGDVVTHGEFSIAVRSEEERALLTALVRDMHVASEDRVVARPKGSAP